MAGFSLGGNKLNQPSSEDQIPPENLFLYHGGGGSGHRTEEITSTYTKGFEIWQQQQQQQQQRQHHHHQLHLYSGATGGLGIFGDDALSGAGAGPSSVAIGSTSGGRGIRGSGGGISCQDCGNQAKKDCMHMRCRTCCKSRNFQCPTHVKSTWVPAAKRRERHQQLTAAMQQQQQQQQSSSLLRGGSGDASKRPREITTLVCPRLANTASTSGGGREVAGSLPPEVSSPAMFRCVRVSSINDTDEQYAYETAVNIGGHIFRGILFDQGLESSSHYSAAGPAVAGGSSLAAAIASTATTTTAVGSSLMDPSPSFYPTPINSFFSGTQFFPNTRP